MRVTRRWKHAILLYIVLVFLLVAVPDLFAWNDSITHRALSVRAANSSVLNRGLLLHFGFTPFNGVEEGTTLRQFVNPEIMLRIQDGADFEDGNIFSARVLRHFHDPPAPLGPSGLITRSASFPAEAEASRTRDGVRYSFPITFLRAE